MNECLFVYYYYTHKMGHFASKSGQFFQLSTTGTKRTYLRGVGYP